jgi:hypothetical protein
MTERRRYLRGVIRVERTDASGERRGGTEEGQKKSTTSGRTVASSQLTLAHLTFY